MREHLQRTCKQLQHVNIRNMSNAGNEGTQQFDEKTHARLQAVTPKTTVVWKQTMDGDLTS